MPPIYPSDLQDAARALLAQDAADRAAAARTILFRAFVADRYRKKFKQPHPKFGCGSLGAAARSFEMSIAPRSCDKEYLSCMQVMIEATLSEGQYHGT